MQAIVQGEARDDGLEKGVTEDAQVELRAAVMRFGAMFIEEMLRDFDDKYETESTAPLPSACVISAISTTDLYSDIRRDIRNGITRSCAHFELRVPGDGNCQFLTFCLGKRLNEAVAACLEGVRQGHILSAEDLNFDTFMLDGNSSACKTEGLDLRTKAVDWWTEFDEKAPNGLDRGTTLDLYLAQTGAVEEGVDAEQILLDGGKDPKQHVRRLQYLANMSRIGVWGDELTGMSASAILDHKILVHRRVVGEIEEKPVVKGATVLPKQPNMVVVQSFNRDVGGMFHTMNGVWSGAHYNLMASSYKYFMVASMIGMHLLPTASPISALH